MCMRSTSGGHHTHTHTHTQPIKAQVYYILLITKQLMTGGCALLLLVCSLQLLMRELVYTLFCFPISDICHEVNCCGMVLGTMHNWVRWRFVFFVCIFFSGKPEASWPEMGLV